MIFAERISEAAKTFTEKVRGRGDGYRAHAQGTWRMSQIGHCARQQAYQYLNTKVEEFSKSPQRTMSLEDGHLHEGELISRILALPDVVKIAENRPCERTIVSKSGKKVTLVGTPDLEIKDHGEPVVVEIKALQDNNFTETKKTEEPPKEYVLQLQGYMIILKYKKGVLLIKNRNNSEVLSFEFEWNKEEFNAILKRQFHIQELVDQKKLPEREYELGSRECFYCAFTKNCYPGEDFKGFVHESGEKRVEVDLDDEPEDKARFMAAVRLYDSSQAKLKLAEIDKDEAKEKLEGILTKFKASGISAGGYSASYVHTTRKDPDRTVVKQLIESGAIPVVVNTSSYIKVGLPKKVKAKND